MTGADEENVRGGSRRRRTSPGRRGRERVGDTGKSSGKRRHCGRSYCGLVWDMTWKSVSYETFKDGSLTLELWHGGWTDTWKLVSLLTSGDVQRSLLVVCLRNVFTNSNSSFIWKGCRYVSAILKLNLGVFERTGRRRELLGCLPQARMSEVRNVTSSWVMKPTVDKVKTCWESQPSNKVKIIVRG